MPGGRVAIVQTRWHMDDLTGVTNDMIKNELADQYEIVEFPALLDAEDADGKPIMKPLWPEFFDFGGFGAHKSLYACISVELTVSTEAYSRGSVDS